MKKGISTVMLLALTLSSATAFGEDRVVVIPMMDEVKIEAPIEWKDQWQEGASYIPGDGAQYAGSSYICIESHTASVDNAPPNSSFWSLMAAQGAKGETGATGAQGIQGPQGIVGPPGIPGPQGIPGPVGDTGPQGIPGPKGDIGAAGPQGIPGAQGPIGPPGPAGPQGIPGPVGAIGPQGIQGPAGTSGIQVYDANNQNLGTLLSFTDAENFFTVFNSAIDLPVKISKDTGDLYKRDLGTVIYPNASSCDGTPSYVAPGTAIIGVLVANPDQYSSDDFPYISYRYPQESLTVSKWATLVIGIGCSYYTPPIERVITAYSIKYYKDIDVPITFPIAFPLRFETP